jgi:AraC-like DNA-binding protein
MFALAECVELPRLRQIMLRSRHHDEPDVRGYAVTHPPGRAVLPIERGWDQLLYAESGAMAISTPTGSWVIPSHRALWIPDSAPATIVNRSPVAVRTLYFAAELSVLPFGAGAVNVPALVHTLLIHTVLSCPLRLENRLDAALLTVLVDQLRTLPEAPLRLPWPVDPRAVDAANAIVADTSLDLEATARQVGSSRRTIERAFTTETGLSLGAWRRRAHILNSLEALAGGASVTATAMAAGYTTPSAYVVAFKKELGETPRQYLRGWGPTSARRRSSRDDGARRPTHPR